MSRSKFGNIRTTIDGVTFDSKAEAARYVQLKALLRAGAIRDLEWRKSKLRFPCHVNGVKVCDYEADFSYVDSQTGLKITEDVKGMRLPLYLLKRKLVFALHGITITEVSVK